MPVIHDLSHFLKEYAIVSLDLCEACLHQSLFFVISHEMALRTVVDKSRIMEGAPRSVFQTRLNLPHASVVMLVLELVPLFL